MKLHTTLLLAALLLYGCATHPRTTRVVDVTKGEYYTNEEIKGLSGEERDRYCAALEAQIQAYRDEAKRYDAQADSIRAVGDSLRTHQTSLTTELRDLENEVRQLRLARRAGTSYLVKAGDTLQKISAAVYGTPERWNDILEANRDRIGRVTDPLPPGMRLTIPAK